MKNSSLLKTGITCTCVSGLCCVTPVLVILLGTAGLSAWVGYLDYVLVPMFAVSVGIIAYALIARWRQRDRT